MGLRIMSITLFVVGLHLTISGMNIRGLGILTDSNRYPIIWICLIGLVEVASTLRGWIREHQQGKIFFIEED